MSIIRQPYGVAYKEESGFKDVYGGAGGIVFVECMRIAPAEAAAKRAIVFTYPIGGGSFLPLVTSLAHAGHDMLLQAVELCNEWLKRTFD